MVYNMFQNTYNGIQYTVYSLFFAPKSFEAMMKLDLQRTERGDRYTMGRLAIDGVAFCDTLEPTDRHLEAAKPYASL